MDALIMVDEVPDLGAIYRKDSGCRKSPHCLDCPLPICVYDNPPESPKPEPRSRWYARRKSDGRCASCSDQAIAGESRCAWHKANNVQRQRAYRAKRRDARHAD